MKSNSAVFAVCLLVVHQFVVPAYSQSIQSRHYRPHPNKCDRNGRCSPKEGYIEEADHDEDDKSDKDRPPVLTRDDWPTRPHVSEPDKDEKLGGGRPSGGYGGGYNPKPVIDREDVKPVVTRPGGGYVKPSGSRDDDTKPDVRPTGGGGYGGGYNPKPVVDRDDDLKPIRPGGGGGYGGGHNPKPVDKDDDIRPIRVRPGGGGGYGGGYNPKPVIDKDDDIKPDVRPTGDGYNPKPTVDKDDDLKPIRPGGGGGGYGGGYNPKPVDKEDDIKPIRVRPGGGGGYGGGYNPKPVVDTDDDLKSGGGGYGGGRPKPAVDRDDDLKPLRPGTGGGYDPKPVDRDDYDVKPIEKDGVVGRPVGGYIPKPGGVRGGGYNPKPDVDDYEIKPIRPGGYPDDDRKPDKEDHGGYNKQKDDDYNVSDKDDVSDYDYGGDDKPIPVVDGNCICVPYYQCKDGHIVTDGGGIIDARKRPDPEEELPLDGKFQPPSCGPFHVCCNTPESSTVKPYEHRCGVRNPSGINSRILSPSNKGEADFGEWPWQAAVLKSEGKVNIFQCGGVLIDKYHVLTVAHCVFHLYQFNEYPLKVRLGEWDTQTTTEFLAHEDYRVSKIIVHPEYRNTSLWNDVAVLRLQDPVLFAPHIDTVCLPQYDEVFGGQNCVVTGWGKDAYKGGTFSNVMKEVALQVIDNYKCEEMLRKTRLGRFFQLHEGFLCAGGEYGLDSCKGDGGGPLVCYRKDKSYALAGIVSWGIDCGQPGVPGVYVKIQKYLEWISKTTGVTLQEYWPKQ